MKKYFLFALTLPLLLLFGCQDHSALETTGDETAELGTISGTISYRERIALSPAAEVVVSLQDVSLQDVPAILIAQKSLTPGKQVPIHFELEYDKSEILEHHSYAISARITDHDQLLFINDTRNPVLTRGAGDKVDMMLIRVARPPEVSPSLPDTTNEGNLKGMFSYLADAAVFRDCRNDKRYPVSMEGQYIELERAYLNSGIEPGSEVMVELKGRLLERKAMEGNSNKVKLIVDKVIKLHPDKTCAPDVHANLIGTYWKLLEVGGNKVTTPEGMKEAHLILNQAESRAHGNAGCNNFFGQFETDEEKLTFSAVGSTRMACPQGMDTEQAFLQALGATTRFSISGLFMELYNKDKLLARLEAVYL